MKERKKYGLKGARRAPQLSQNVNQFLIVSTFTRIFWFKLVQIINLTKNLRGLKHQHLAGAFFLASIQDNSSALFEY